MVGSRMKPGAQLVRLLVAVLVAFASCYFASTYGRFALWKFTHEHVDGRIIAAIQVLGRYGGISYAVPVLTLTLGLWLLRFRSGATASFGLLRGRF